MPPACQTAEIEQSVGRTVSTSSWHFQVAGHAAINCPGPVAVRLNICTLTDNECLPTSCKQYVKREMCFFFILHQLDVSLSRPIALTTDLAPGKIKESARSPPRTQGAI